MSYAALLFAIAIGAVTMLAFFCGHYKGRCDEMDSRKEVVVTVETSLPKMERVK